MRGWFKVLWFDKSLLIWDGNFNKNYLLHMHVVQCDKNVISTFQEEEIGVKIGNGFILADEEVVFR